MFVRTERQSFIGFSLIHFASKHMHKKSHSLCPSHGLHWNIVSVLLIYHSISVHRRIPSIGRRLKALTFYVKTRGLIEFAQRLRWRTSLPIVNRLVTLMTECLFCQPINKLVIRRTNTRILRILVGEYEITNTGISKPHLL